MGAVVGLVAKTLCHPNALEVEPPHLPRWRLCWHTFLNKENLQLKFWCLRVISLATPKLPAGERLELRSALLAWWLDVALSKQEVATSVSLSAYLF